MGSEHAFSLPQKHRKMGREESEVPTKNELVGALHLENTTPSPTRANNLGHVCRKWSSQCHLCLTFFFIWTDTRLGSAGRLSMSSHQPCVRPHGRPSCCLPEALGTGSLNLWRGRTLCASPWPALNWSSVVCG